MSDPSQGGTPAGDPGASAPLAEPVQAAPAGDGDDSRFGEHAGYIKQLRQEAAGYRTKASQYDDVFGQYDDDDRALWLETAREFAQDPLKASDKLETIVKNVRKQLGTQEPKPADTAPGDQPLTAAQVEKMISDARKADDDAKALASETEKIIGEAKKLGYEKGTWGFKELLGRAMDEHGGDLAKAHEAIQADRQAIIDQALTGKQRTAFPKPVTQAGAVPSQKSEIKTFADSRASLEARLAAQRTK